MMQTLLYCKYCKLLYKYLIYLFRNKVDLTKYIEEHNFNFDNVFDY